MGSAFSVAGNVLPRKSAALLDAHDHLLRDAPPAVADGRVYFLLIVDDDAPGLGVRVLLGVSVYQKFEQCDF